MFKFIAFLVLCLMTITQFTSAHYLDSPYKELIDCDGTEACWSFVDDYMLKIINRFEDSDNKPCIDFFEYANNNNYLTEKDNNIFDLIEGVFDYKVEQFLKKTNVNDEDKQDIRSLVFKLKYFSEQCEQHKDVETPPLLKDLPAIPTINWPDWKKALEEPEWQTNLSWINYVAEFRRFGLNRLFFEEHVTIAFNDSTKYVVELKIPEENGKDKLQSNFEYILTRFNLTESQIYKKKQFVSRIQELEELASNVRSMHRLKYNQKENKKLLTLGELKKLVNNIDWQNYFDALLKEWNVSKNLPIQISNLDYFKDIGTLIDQTDDKALAFYMLLRLLYYGLQEMSLSSASCAQKLSELHPIGAYYIYDRFIYKTKNEDIDELEKIFTALKMQFLKKIKENKLNLSVQEQKFLKQKLNEIDIRILSQDESTSYYNHYYHSKGRTSFWNDQWEIMRFNVDKQHAILFENDVFMEPNAQHEREDPDKQRSEPFFIKSLNRIAIPFEFISPPLFTHGRNPVFRYSITAFSLARELMKAFDPNGISIDAKGNENEIGIGILQNPKFQEVWKCVDSDTAQYFAERFADVSGFQLVVDTFFNDLPKTGENSYIITETKTNSQVTYEIRKIFFLQLAQYFVGHVNNVYRYESYSKKQNFNERLNMIVSNVPQFAEVFNCTLENTKKKCQIW